MEETEEQGRRQGVLNPCLQSSENPGDKVLKPRGTILGGREGLCETEMGLGEARDMDESDNRLAYVPVSVGRGDPSCHPRFPPTERAPGPWERGSHASLSPRATRPLRRAGVLGASRYVGKFQPDNSRIHGL